MPQIRPITDLRNTNEISALCHKKQEPIFITKNGYGDLVLMSIETYESQMAIVELCKKYVEDEADVNKIEDINLIDIGEAIKKLRNKKAE